MFEELLQLDFLTNTLSHAKDPLPEQLQRLDEVDLTTSDHDHKQAVCARNWNIVRIKIVHN